MKTHANGSIERYKAQLVAQGFTQTYGINYAETFAPMAKLNSIQVLLSLVVNLDWPLFQLDVKNAFLNGDWDEEIYMKIPPGFEHEVDNGRACRFKRSIYGLKPSPRAWFKKFSMTLNQLGYKQRQANHTLFTKHAENGKRSILIVYVDDIIVTGDDMQEIDNLNKQLRAEFEVKDLGIMRYFLGMEVARSKEELFISQKKYTIDLLEDTGMLACRPAGTPLDKG